MSAVVIAGMNTVGFAITALTKSHKITDLTVGFMTLAMSLNYQIIHLCLIVSQFGWVDVCVVD